MSIDGFVGNEKGEMGEGEGKREMGEGRGGG